ncbi:MAG: M18 family aminopeptidase [Lentisphaeria bacterium]|nr:M18 family aminopeptidase [Candidatus Neomarinimicrobiota bacterium]MCF7841391.1 M18 family aminopeptidase [Lentisphaeria bacterium]
MSGLSKDSMSAGQDLLDFINASPTAYHAVIETRKRLKDSGYTELHEHDEWQLEAGGKYYTTRSDTALIAWHMGTQPAWETGIRLISAHSDSPGFRIKPNGAYTQAGYLQFGIEVYGGPLIASWTDRDLSIAGRVLVTNDGLIQAQPVWVRRPILRIAQLAIHLNRKVNEEGLVLNQQQHIPPIVALTDTGETIDSQSVIDNILSEELQVEPDRIVSWELELIDTQPGQVGGLNNEFIFSGRIDNLAMCHAQLTALQQIDKRPVATSMMVMFDNEEVGSNTAAGGASPFIRHVFQRVLESGQSPSHAFQRGLARSFCISADGAHAVHPNYVDYHDKQHRVQMNGGPVIKHSARERYATDGDSTAIFKTLCKDVSVPVQHYIHRTDLPCGSTIGPITATNLGIPVVDVGTAMLSMHSVRETCGTADSAMMIKVLQRFFEKETLWQV